MIDLIFWQKGRKEKADAAAVASLFDTWWTTVKTWLAFPFQHYSVDTAPLFIVDLLAWERDVTRYTGEPENLYRLRVEYAFQNAVDAGSRAGIERIWSRLGLGEITITERPDSADWDVVYITMNAQDIADNTELLTLLVSNYGRTCRRVYINVDHPQSLAVVPNSAAHGHTIHHGETAAFGQLLTYNGEPLTINGELLELN